MLDTQMVDNDGFVVQAWFLELLTRF